MQRYTLALCHALLLTSTLFGQIEISSRFEPSVIPPGQRATYVIEIRGDADNPRGHVPNVPGLEISYMGPSRMVSIRNGKTTTQMQSRYAVVAENAGTYTIPEFTIEIGRKPYRVPAATLTVRSPAPEEQRQQPYWLEIELPRERLYVGEAVEARLRLYVRSDTRFSMNQGFLKDGNAFSEPRIANEPQHRNVSVGGIEHNLYIWNFTIVPLKAGRHALQMDTVITVPQRHRSLGGIDPFNDPFFRDFQLLGGTQNLRLSGRKDQIEVLPVPQAGQPPSYSGGIGLFSISEPTLRPPETRVGEPLSLSVEIAGRGNFERLNAPLLDASAQWRILPQTPQFETEDNLETVGKKTFSYILVPEDTTPTQTPTLRFSYFNPEVAEYVEFTLPGKPVQVLPALPSPAPAAPPAPSRIENEKPHALVPDKIRPGRTTPRLVPEILQPRFLLTQALLLLAAATLVGLRWRHQRLQANPQRRRRREAQQAVRAALELAARSTQDSEAFHASIVLALNEAIAALDDANPHALTPDEARLLLEKHGADKALMALVHQHLEAANAVRYGQSATGEASGKTLEEIRRLTLTILDLP